MTMDNTIENLATYAPLGRSGLCVSPLCIGTMTFGNEEGWGSSEATARTLLARYLEAGGNFVDTADLYTGGDSERMLGKFMREMNNRDRLVLATKYTFNQFPEDPNAGGNSRKHLREALHASLQRLQTDYIDLYWMHTWDTMTPRRGSHEHLERPRAGRQDSLSRPERRARLVRRVCTDPC
ncbi:aldo/keto reductase [Roseovarius pacificus]|uniref:aldo/keto reductase n=1 Tax=Roseovarius pacificus TaxID=337701 RepID=UPI002A18C3C7|nr:aldo/keto reductase [Roseovarius pacificus]